MSRGVIAPVSSCHVCPPLSLVPASVCAVPLFMPVNDLRVQQTSKKAAFVDFCVVAFSLILVVLCSNLFSMSQGSSGVFVHVAETKANVPGLAGAFVAQASARAIQERGRFVIALSGGSLPGLLASGLVDDKTVEWDKWHVFFADERIVPLDHKDSNYLGCHEALFSKVPIPREQIYTIDPSLDPVACAKSYESTLSKICQNVIDLAMLGMGPDGHTCSLFPEHPLLKENVLRVASIIDSPKPPPQRITLTLRAIQEAKQVAFVAAGGGKSETIVQVLLNAKVDFSSEQTVCSYTSGVDADNGSLLPSSIVQKVAKETHWFVDKPAAEGILAKCDMAPTTSSSM